MVMKKEMRQYFSAVKKALGLVSGRRHIMEDLRHEVEVYLESKPEATVADIEAVFGTPEAMAQVLLADLDPETVKAGMEKARFVRRVVLYTAIALVVIFVVIMIGIVIWNFNTSPVYYYDNVFAS